MIAILYRYPHPYDATKFIYCGQEHLNPKCPRDRKHRTGKSSFGRRYRQVFPAVELPQPVRQVVEVQDQFELNELETIWMFQYHTWRGYGEGMNLTLPGSTDYEVIGRVGGLIGNKNQSREGKILGGKIAGRKVAESGQLARTREMAVAAITGGHRRGDRQLMDFIRNLPQTKKAVREVGRKNVESGHLARIRNLPQQKEALCTANCFRWNICRNKLCTCGKHK